MKIAMVFPVFNKGGGIQRALVELTLQLVRDGHELHVVANNWDRHDAGITFHHVPMMKPNNPLQMTSFCLASTLALRGRLARQGFDIIHSHGAATLEADVITAQSCHRAWVHHSGAGLSPFSRPWVRRHLNPQHPAIMLVERYQYGYRHYGKIVSVAQGVKREIMDQYGTPEDDIVVIPNGVNLAEFAAERLQIKREATRTHLGFTSEDRVLLLVANEFARKGLAELLHALALLPNSVHLLCVGRANPAPYVSDVARHGLQGRVHFVSHSRDIAAYYAASDAFVMPTHYEAFSLATLEAAAAGLPLICTKVNGTEELIIDGYNGLFVKREGGDIATKVRWLLDVPGRIRILGDAARETAQGYQWPLIKDRHLEVYRELVEARTAASAAQGARGWTGHRGRWRPG